MTNFKFIFAALFCACSVSSAQDTVLTGHVQRVILEPSGTEDCPRPCPVVAAVQPNRVQTVCMSNEGGCQTMEVKVDHVYRGTPGVGTRQFKSRIGEWGPTFPVTEKQIAVIEEAGKVSWSLATVRDGRIFIDTKRIWSIGGIRTSAVGEGELVALDEVLARSGAGR